jgi:hypothetical protein
MGWRELLQVRKIIPKTGEPGSVEIPRFLLADVPDATKWTGHQIIVTNSTPQALCYSDGTNWIATDDGTTVA